MKTNIMEVITYKKQTSKTKHIIVLNIGNFFSEKKKAAFYSRKYSIHMGKHLFATT